MITVVLFNEQDQRTTRIAMWIPLVVAEIKVGARIDVTGIAKIGKMLQTRMENGRVDM